ncbi:MAG TPA: hypothetical protein VGZ69_07660 [Candidatus Rhabdochlamydia sp.]|nr:hypothetical protein [Candidatus Rhabdochlamydia sp.]
MTLFRKRGNFAAALIAMILGAMGFFLFRIYPIEFPREIANILLSSLGYIFGEIAVNYRVKVENKSV